MIKYYVLWKKNNEMLAFYLDKYYYLLLEKLKNIISIDLYSNLIEIDNNRDFIINWDISSLINRLDTLKNNENKEYIDIKRILDDEITKLFSWNISELSYMKGVNIWNTNIKLTLNDLNPYAKFDAHPQHKETWGILWWWEKSETQWIEIYTKTFELLKIVDDGFYNELNTIIQKIIPLWTSKNLHNSASHKPCIGHLYMWYTLWIDQPELSNLEAIIHESSHNKLHLLFQFDKIVLNSMEENYYSPFRPDARHVKGVFLAIHAFVPTIYILMKAYKNWRIKSEHWLEKIILYYIKNKITYKVLKKYAKFSELWENIMIEVYYVMRLTDSVFKSLNIDKNIINNAINREKEHFEEVNNNFPNFKY